MASRNVTDPDVWWHLRTGELILATHTIPHSDPYSFTKSGQPWIDHEWLSQILIYSTYRVAGYGGLIAEFGLIIAAAFGLVFLRSPGRPYIAGLLTAWGALASVPSWGVRPQMLTLLLASLLLLILDRSYRHPKLLWLAPLLILLWVNLHAGYALGLALMVLYLIGDALDVAFGQSEVRDHKKWFVQFIVVIAVSIAIVPLNPYGARMYSYPLDTLRSPAMLANIAEWLSPNFHQGKNLPALLLILTVFALATLSPKKLRPKELLLLTILLFAGLRSVRHIPIFVIVAVPIVSGLIQSWLEESGKAKIFEIPSGSLSSVKTLVNAVILLGTLIFAGAHLHHVIAGQPQAEAKEFPAAAVSFLASSHPPGEMLNHYNWGGYFIWKLYPEYRVFIDGRADLYGDAFVNDFAALYYLKRPSWQEQLEKCQIRTVVLPPDAPLVAALEILPQWKKVFSDGQVVVLVR